MLAEGTASLLCLLGEYHAQSHARTRVDHGTAGRRSRRRPQGADGCADTFGWESRGAAALLWLVPIGRHRLAGRGERLVTSRCRRPQRALSAAWMTAAPSAAWMTAADFNPCLPPRGPQPPISTRAFSRVDHIAA